MKTSTRRRERALATGTAFAERTTAPRPKVETPAPRAQPFFAPRFWLGANARAWYGLMARNHFAVSPSRWHVLLSHLLYSPCNSLLGGLQSLVYDRRVASAEMREAPLFILGHWRNGTTLLHELLTQDARFTYPTTYQCLSPNHFLLTEGFFTRWLGFVVPSQRPMDNMRLSFDGPQEEEFAFCNMGMRSPYLTVAFPNHPPQDDRYLDLVNLSPSEMAAWKQGFVRFLRFINYRDARRIVLKSPPHTARVRVLLEMFPQAQFVHIVRNPYKVFLSTVHLWRSLYTLHGLQVPTFQGLEDYVFGTYLRMFQRYEADRERIPAGALVELRYEDLVADPRGQLQTLYDRLSLGSFEQALPAVERYLAANENYQTNRYELSAELRGEIGRRWAPIFARYGYPVD